MREGQPAARQPLVRPRPRGRTRIGLAGLASLALLAGISLATPVIALGADGYTEHIATTYTVNAAARRIDVAMDIDFKNTSKPTASTIFYYNGDHIFLDQDATDVHATSPGEVITLTKQTSGKAYEQWFVRWEPVLFYGKTRHVHLTYQLPSGPPRSDSKVRINPAYADFCVVASGHDGGSTTVRVPTTYGAYVTDEEGGGLTRGQSGAYDLFSTGNLANPYDFWGCLTGENPAGFGRSSATSPSGRKITIEAWPDDFDWAFEVNSQIGSILSQLETLVGSGLPGANGITVREVGTGQLGNYAGFFDPETSTVRIGEDLELQGLVAHEVSHAWFNGDLFADHWMAEGSAEWARISIVKDTCVDPGPYPGLGTADLTNWQFAGPKATKLELDVVDWQYAAACTIVTQVAGRAGSEHWRTVLHALLNHEAAYGSGVPAGSGAASWRTWLDDVDELGLVPAGLQDLDFAQQLLLKYGVPEGAGSRDLEKRSAARKAYHGLTASLGGWTVPLVIRDPMAEWKFDDATKAMTETSEIYATAAQVKTIVPEADATTGKVKSLVEAAKAPADLDAALAEAKDEVDAANTVKAARDAFAAPLDLVGKVGMIGVTLQPTVDAAVQAMVAGDLSTARADSASVQASLAEVPHTGKTRIGIAVGVTLALLLLIAFFVVRRRRRRRVAAALALASAAPPLDGVTDLTPVEEFPVGPEPAPIEATSSEDALPTDHPEPQPSPLPPPSPPDTPAVS